MKHKPTEFVHGAQLIEDVDVVLVSRQPIYDRVNRLFAYELLYGNECMENALLQDREKGRTDVLLNAFLEVGLENLTGESPALVNVTRESILHGYCRALPHERVILGICGDIEPEEDILRSLRELKETGYALALDGFIYDSRKDGLLELADYVNFSFDRFTNEEIAAQLPMLGKFKGKRLARGLDHCEQFEFAKSAGFDYFRGACFTSPKPVKATRVPLNRLSTLQLVLKLQEPELNSTELERLVSQDVTISFKLLQYVNSASLGLPRNIQSIRHAIQLVGTQRIRAWASLLLLTRVDDGPSELVSTALVRATMAERLAMALGNPSPESYFMVGLFSVVDALLNMPMADALELLPLAKPIRQALVDKSGSMGMVLWCILAYESGRWGDVRCDRLPLASIRQCYLDALAVARATRALSKA